MSLYCTVSEIDGDFSRKSQNFPIPKFKFCAPAEGVPLALGTGAAGQKPWTSELSGQERSLTISSAMWIQCTHVTDGQTDGETGTGQRPRLRIASRGRKDVDEFCWNFWRGGMSSLPTKYLIFGADLDHDSGSIFNKIYTTWDGRIVRILRNQLPWRFAIPECFLFKL